MARWGSDPLNGGECWGFVNKDRGVTLQEATNQFIISKASAHQILHEKLRQSKSARWVLKQLTEDQKISRMTIAKEHLGRFNHDQSRFVVTGDEMWVHYVEPETKAQSSGNELVPHLPSFKLFPPAGKVLQLLFVIHVEYFWLISCQKVELWLLDTIQK